MPINSFPFFHSLIQQYESILAILYILWKKCNSLTAVSRLRGKVNIYLYKCQDQGWCSNICVTSCRLSQNPWALCNNFLKVVNRFWMQIHSYHKFPIFFVLRLPFQLTMILWDLRTFLCEKLVWILSFLGDSTSVYNSTKNVGDFPSLPNFFFGDGGGGF